MNRHLAQALGAMALGTLLLQPVTAMADPPAHARNENSAKHRGPGWKENRREDDRRHDDRGHRSSDDRRYDERRYDERRYYDQGYRDRSPPQYYPRRGYVVDRLPPHHRVVHHHGDRYYYSGGAWYRPYGPQFIVVAPPMGLVVSFLPDFQATFHFGAVPYYQAGPVYYAWHPQARGYVVTDDPYRRW
jgi:hypothetical protein